jgi:hypothetical protein
MTASTRPTMPTSSFVLPWYRFRELDAFEPWERGAVAEDAAEVATTHPGVLAGWALTLAPLVIIAARYHEQLRLWPMWMVIGVALLAFIPLFLYRRTVVHALVVERAHHRRAQAPVDRPAPSA